MFMNRIAPAESTLYFSNADGSNKRQLLSDADASFDYHAQWSPGGEWISFTSERAGDGQSDVYRVRPDGSGLEAIANTSYVEDASIISPNGSLIAYQGTLGNYKSNIWIQDLTTGDKWNITDSTYVAGNSSLPDGHFRPAWSPNGVWIVFSSDKDTLWRGHDNISGWEHTQELSIYAIRPDGSDYRKLANQTGRCLGSPKFSPDGSRVVFYEIETEQTYDARVAVPQFDDAGSFIVSVDFETGEDRIVHATNDSVKLFPQYVNSNTIGYLTKGLLNGSEPGESTSPGSVNYTSATSNGTLGNYSSWDGVVRSPSWSPNGSLVVFEAPNWLPIRDIEKQLYSWQDDWEYRFMEIFSRMSLQGKIAYTQEQIGLGSLMVQNPDGSDLYTAFNSTTTGQVSLLSEEEETAGAFKPEWSSNGEVLAVGLGSYFPGRYSSPGWIYLVDANGSSYTEMTDGSTNAGFPSLSPDGKYLIWREWDYNTTWPLGIKRMDLETKEVIPLTTWWDNLPSFSPDGTNILFMRRTSWPINSPYQDNYDILTMDIDGSNVQTLTTSQANDAHPVWTHEGKIQWATGMYGFQDEAAIYDNNQQPYSVLMEMNVDGTNKTPITVSRWEDTMPLYVPNEFWTAT